MGFRSREILRQGLEGGPIVLRARGFRKISALTGVTTPVTLLSALLNNHHHRRYRCAAIIAVVVVAIINIIIVIAIDVFLFAKVAKQLFITL